ncbi:unnamed protein product [Clonostachys rosea]|uniref:Uncharacterized protein n=1 Tax=Bionectria ochroleuca TaxID=29856 RepID=A0ABY6TUW9_BIOOC|nr:unnamed protein product [Clonostachys rosea]
MCSVRIAMQPKQERRIGRADGSTIPCGRKRYRDLHQAPVGLRGVARESGNKPIRVPDNVFQP